MSRPYNVLQCPTERLANDHSLRPRESFFFPEAFAARPDAFTLLGDHFGERRCSGDGCGTAFRDAAQRPADHPRGAAGSRSRRFLIRRRSALTAIRSLRLRLVCPFSLNIDPTGILAPRPPRPRWKHPGGVWKYDSQLQVATGIAYSPDGRLLYDATGDTGAYPISSSHR